MLCTSLILLLESEVLKEIILHDAVNAINKYILQKMHQGSETGSELTVLTALQLTCFAAAVQASGCSASDTVCQCTTGKDKITASVTPCIEKSCSASDAASTCSFLLFLSQHSSQLRST